MILDEHLIPANTHDSKGLVPLIKKVRPQHSQEALSEKGYKCKENDELLSACGSWSRSNPMESFKVVRDLPYVSLHITSEVLSIAYSPSRITA